MLFRDLQTRHTLSLQAEPLKHLLINKSLQNIAIIVNSHSHQDDAWVKPITHPTSKNVAIIILIQFIPMSSFKIKKAWEIVLITISQAFILPCHIKICGFLSDQTKVITLRNPRKLYSINCIVANYTNDYKHAHSFHPV